MGMAKGVSRFHSYFPTFLDLSACYAEPPKSAVFKDPFGNPHSNPL